ncbi:MAG: WecB/TagA/CpsF family glycosyltransferase [Bacteroides graminisolvens]|nr:WecB/TagA/CpsF family glycosyltransferase [Bacteroides graminisolvens]
MKIFNIHIEFDSKVFCKTVEDYIAKKQKAYVCVVDANVITIAQKDFKYREIVMGANINTCDGSSISKMANSIYGTNYSAFNGPELFEYYIELPYKHVLVGNTQKKVDQIKAKVTEKGLELDLQHVDVPFVPVEEFDYSVIAKQINELKPDIVWVSLGAPKQETFISNIFPYIEQGVLFGIGAAFNFYTGDLHNNKKEIGGLRFIWLERIFKEPKKQLNRVGKFLLLMPKMYFEEKQKAKALKK